MIQIYSRDVRTVSRRRGWYFNILYLACIHVLLWDHGSVKCIDSSIELEDILRRMYPGHITTLSGALCIVRAVFHPCVALVASRGDLESDIGCI
jgi:hypothetical protein